MKKIFVLLLFAVAHAGQAFDAGWRDGFIAGKCQGQAQYCASVTRVPYPPRPYYTEHTYMDGYRRGYVDGLEAQ